MTNHVLVIGSINMDLSVSTPVLPKPGETVTGNGFMVSCGGKGANQAVALAKCGAEVRFLGCTGDDIYASMCLENLEKNGIDCVAVSKTKLPTGVAVITVHNGENTIILDKGANEAVTPDLITRSEELFSWADLLVMQFEIPMESVVAAAALAKKNGAKVVINPAPFRPLPEALLQNTDYLIPNEHEAENITGISASNGEDAVRCLNKLLTLVPAAMITLGEKGCIFGNREQTDYQPAFRVKAVDTTAAGDSFIGGFCSALLGGAAMKDAVQYASAVSAITVNRRGAGVSIPDREETQRFLKSNPACGEPLDCRDKDAPLEQKMVKFVAENFKGKCNLSELAAELQYDYGYLSKLFLKKMKMPFHRYVVRSRIDFAKSLLETTNRSISEIALACGFETIRSFNRNFNSLTGLSPSQFRQKNAGD